MAGESGAQVGRLMGITSFLYALQIKDRVFAYFPDWPGSGRVSVQRLWEALRIFHMFFGRLIRSVAGDPGG